MPEAKAANLRPLWFQFGLSIHHSPGKGEALDAMPTLIG
jgi:hypothetical protein